MESGDSRDDDIREKHEASGENFHRRLRVSSFARGADRRRVRSACYGIHQIGSLSEAPPWRSIASWTLAPLSDISRGG